MKKVATKANWVTLFQRLQRSIKHGQANDHTVASKFVDRSVWGASSPVYLTTHNGPGTMNTVAVYNYTHYDEGTYS